TIRTRATIQISRRISNYSGVYGIIMNIIALLIDDLVVIQQNRIIGVVPNMKIFVLSTLLGKIPEFLKHPFFSYFSRIPLNRFDHFFGGKTFKPSNKFLQI